MESNNEVRSALKNTLQESNELLRSLDAAIVFHTTHLNFTRVKQLSEIKASLLKFAETILAAELENKPANVVNINRGK
jgi:hypothetical protein